jgi:hypothetical protein
MEILRLVVLDNRPVVGDTVNELIVNQTITEKKVQLDGQGPLQV